MRALDGEDMQFVFKGNSEDVKKAIRAMAQDQQKDIVIYQDTPNTLRIGFLRLGYSGGRFFIANVHESNGIVSLEGEIKNLADGMDPEQNNADTRKTFQKIRDMLLEIMAVYGVLALISLMIWWIFDFRHLWIPFAISGIITIGIRLLMLFPSEKRSFETEDEEFLKFMAAVAEVQKKYVPEE